MQLKNTQEALNKFGKYVVQQSRSNLTKNKKNYTKKLYDSLGYEAKEMPNSFLLKFDLGKYGMYQDRGVKGVKSGTSLSNFSYKQSSDLIGLEYATGTFAKWTKFRGIQFRDKKGRFMSFKQTGILMAIGKKNKGIKPSLFFTKPFEKAFKNLPDDLIEAFALDVDNLLEYTTKK